MRARRLSLATLGVGLALSLALGMQLARRAEAEVSARAVAAALVGMGDAAVDWQAEKRRAWWLGFSSGAGGGALLSLGAAVLIHRRAAR